MTRAMILATGFLILAVGSGARFAIGLTLVPMAQDFAMGRGMLGVIVGVYFAVTAVAMFASGRLIDRFSARVVLGAGLLISAAGIGLVAFATAPWQVLVLYGIVFGIGNGLASITPVAIMVTSAFPGRMGFANGIAISGMSAGQLLMVGAMAFVMVGIGWRSVYIWLGIAHLAQLPLLLWVPHAIKSGGAGAAQASGSSLREVFRAPAFWLVLGAQGLCGFDDFFVTTHVVAFAQDRGIATLFAGNLLALMGLTSLVGVLWAGAWSDRSGPVKPMLACFVIRIAIFAAILVDRSPLTVTVFALLFGVTLLMTAPLTVVLVRKYFGTRELGTVAGLILMVHHGLGGLGAWLGGIAFDAQGGYGGAFAAMLAASVVATGLSLALMRPDRAAV